MPDSPSPPSPDKMLQEVRDRIAALEYERDHLPDFDATGIVIWRAILAQLEASRWRIDGQTIVEAARGLVRQIANNDFRDSHGHEATRLREYAVLQRFVSLPSPPATASEGEGA